MFKIKPGSRDSCFIYEPCPPPRLRGDPEPRVGILGGRRCDRIAVLPTNLDGCAGGLANDSKLELPLKVQILMTVSEVSVTSHRHLSWAKL